MENQNGDTLYGRCMLCGKNAVLDSSGICKECEKGNAEQSTSRKTKERNKATRHSKQAGALLPAGKIISAFNSFYKLFKIGGIIVCSVSTVIWIFNFVFGMLNNLAEKTEVAEETAQSGILSPFPSFNPHWEVLLATFLILIGCLLLAYLSQAVAKVIEKITESDYKN